MSRIDRFTARNFARFALAISTAFLAFQLPSLAADAPKEEGKKDPAKVEAKLIKPEEAKDYEDKEVIVEFKVAGAREVASGVCFLNSTTDRDDPAGFTAFIGKKALTKLKTDGLKSGDKTDAKTASKDAKGENKMDKPADFFKKKTLRVSGKVKKYQDKFEIEVTSPDQITVVDNAPAPEKKSEKK